MSRPVVLASRSAARAALLREAGVPIEVLPARVDEAAVKAAMIVEAASPRDIADALAELKAQRIAVRAPDRLVLGVDQVLVCDGRLYDKPADMAEARSQLQSLRGKAHDLVSAAVAFEDGRPVWRHIGRARMTMRPFTDGFLDSYLESHSSAFLSSVGAYRIEAGGAQLFSRIEGDYFSVLGLPLLETLGFLRTRGLCQE